MDFPDISTYPDFQANAIDLAKRQGVSSFVHRWYEFMIERIEDHYTVTASIRGTKVWSVYTSTPRQHYWLEVWPQHQKRWVGKLLYTTKIALDGILSEEWTTLYSRMLFLIKAGYIPTAWTRVLQYKSHDRVLETYDLERIKQPLADMHSWNLESGNRVYLRGDKAYIRLKHEPNNARLFLQSLGIVSKI